MKPTGRGWWDVAGWAAFAVALGLECVALVRGEPLGPGAGWAYLILYVFWMVSMFVGLRAHRLRERIVPHEEGAPAWGRGVLVLVFVPLVFLVATNTEVLHKDLGVPFGALLLAITLLGWLARPVVLRLQGKRLRREGEPTTAAVSQERRKAAETPRTSRRQMLLFGLLGVLLLVLYGVVTHKPSPRLPAEEADAAIRELEELQGELTRMYVALNVQARQLKTSEGADAVKTVAMQRRARKAFAVRSSASAWLLRLQSGKVRVSEREKLERELRDLRVAAEEVRTGRRPDAP